MSRVINQIPICVFFGLSAEEAGQTEHERWASLVPEVLNVRGTIVVTTGHVFGMRHRVIIDTGAGAVIAGRKFKAAHPDIKWGQTKFTFVGLNSQDQLPGKGELRDLKITFENGAERVIQELYYAEEYDAELIIGTPQLMHWGCDLKMRMGRVQIKFGGSKPFWSTMITETEDEYSSQAFIMSRAQVSKGSEPSWYGRYNQGTQMLTAAKNKKSDVR